MEFNLDEYKDKKYCMHCKTLEEAKDFCRVLDSNGRTWSTGDSYTNYTFWNTHESGTVYYFNKGTYGSMLIAQEKQRIILEWSDFM